MKYLSCYLPSSCVFFRVVILFISRNSPNKNVGESWRTLVWESEEEARATWRVRGRAHTHTYTVLL